MGHGVGLFFAYSILLPVRWVYARGEIQCSSVNRAVIFCSRAVTEGGSSISRPTGECELLRQWCGVPRQLSKRIVRLDSLSALSTCGEMKKEENRCNQDSGKGAELYLPGLPGKAC